jgi:transmembrane sensor
MDKITFTSESNKLKVQAAYWFSVMERGFSYQEKHDFSSWLNQETTHRNAFENLSRATKHSAVLNEFSGLFPTETVNHPKKIKKAFLTTAVSIFLFIIITLVIVLTAFSPISSTPSNQNKIYATNIGEQASYTLQDGSVLHLNTNTKIRINYSETQRKLTLLQGEANFDVATDSKRPFTVVTGDASFTALGTIFNIQKNNNPLADIELVVEEGKVLLSKTHDVEGSLNKELSHTELEYLPGTIIYSGEMAVIEKNRPLNVLTISQEKQDKNLAWQQGMLIFNGEPLEEVLEEITRYSENNFVILDPKLTQIKISGLFKSNDIKGLLSSLQSNLSIKYERVKNMTIELSQNEAKKSH